MTTKQSPFDKKITPHEVYKVVDEYFQLTGNVITFDLKVSAKIGLYVLKGDKHEFVGRFPNWEAYKMILELVEKAKDNEPKRFKVPHLSRETYQALIEDLDDETLCDLLCLFKAEYDSALHSNPNFMPEGDMRSHMDAVKRYIVVYQRHQCWTAKNAKRNLKVMLKRYRQWVMSGVNREYEAGAKVFDDKYGVLLV